MIQQGVADLDELVLQCRSEQARQHITEAVACYQAGAYRAAIVATWIAVVFDYLHKLRELDLAGDKNAHRRIQEFEDIRVRSDWRKAVDFERQILELAKDEFELIAASEYLELSRLRDDRNRCAHPSMLSADEPYQPSAELTRYHLRNAVAYLLGQPPVQGKAALDRMLKEIESTYFPSDWHEAREWFAMGPLARAREPLIRSLVSVITKALLLQSGTDAERARRVSALVAILEMYRQVGETTLRDLLPRIVGRVDDDDWRRVVWYLRSIPCAWDFLGSGLQRKTQRFVANVHPERAAPVIAQALHVPALASTATARIDDLAISDLTELLIGEPLPEYIDAAVRRFAAARSFQEARNLGRMLLLPAVPYLTVIQLRAALNAFVDNNQISKCIGMAAIFTTILQQTAAHTNAAQAEWSAIRNKLEKNSLDEAEMRLRDLIETDVLCTQTIDLDS